MELSRNVFLQKEKNARAQIGALLNKNQLI
jgi:hypothetical protein